MSAGHGGQVVRHTAARHAWLWRGNFVRRWQVRRRTRAVGMAKRNARGVGVRDGDGLVGMEVAVDTWHWLIALCCGIVAGTCMEQHASAC